MVAAVQLADLAKRGDAARQQSPAAVLLEVYHHCPAIALVAQPPGPGLGNTSRLGHIQDQHPARHQRLLDSAQKRCLGLGGVVAGEQVVEDLADGGHADAWRQFGRPQRPHPKLGPGHTTPSQLDHRRRLVDPQHLVARPGDALRQETAAAAEVDHQPALPGRQRLKQYLRGVAGHVAVAGIVDVGQVVAVVVGHDQGRLLVPTPQTWIPTAARAWATCSSVGGCSGWDSSEWTAWVSRSWLDLRMATIRSSALVRVRAAIWPITASVTPTTTFTSSWFMERLQGLLPL